MLELISRREALFLTGTEAALGQLQIAGAEINLPSGARLWICREGGLVGFILEGAREQIEAELNRLGTSIEQEHP